MRARWARGWAGNGTLGAGRREGREGGLGTGGGSMVHLGALCFLLRDWWQSWVVAGAWFIWEQGGGRGRGAGMFR